MPVMRAKGGKQVTNEQAICALEELRFWAKNRTVKLEPVQFGAIDQAIIALKMIEKPKSIKVALETADRRGKNNDFVPEAKDDGQKRVKPVHDDTSAFDWFFQDVFGMARVAKDSSKTLPKQGKEK